MRTRNSVLLGAALASMGCIASLGAEKEAKPDQSIVLEGTPNAIEIPAQLKDGDKSKPPSGLAQATVVALLETLIGSTRPGGAARKAGEKEDALRCRALTPATYYVLHLVRHGKGEPATREDAWYAFYCGWLGMSSRERVNDPDYAMHYRQARLFGAKRLSFLYLHYDVPMGTVDRASIIGQLRKAWIAELPPEESVGDSKEVETIRRIELQLFWKRFEEANEGVAFRDIEGNKEGEQPDFGRMIYGKLRMMSVNELDKLALRLGTLWTSSLEGADPRITGPRGQRLRQIPTEIAGGPLYVEADFLPISYRIDITKKNPVWRDNLASVLGQFDLQGASIRGIKIEMKPKALFGYSLENEINYPTSNIAITGVRGKAEQSSEESKLIATKKYDNEKKYNFDFGFALPVKSVKELSFSGAAQQVQPKPVEKNRIYGTASIFLLGPVDTKASKLWRFSPELIYGMALDKTPWNHHLIAIGFGLKYVQPFFGITGTRLGVAAEDGSVASYRWGWRSTYGLKIPVASISDLIKKAGN